MDPAPAGVRLTTLLPEKISVDNSSHETALTATVKNEERRTAERSGFWWSDSTAYRSRASRAVPPWRTRICPRVRTVDSCAMSAICGRKVAVVRRRRDLRSEQDRKDLPAGAGQRRKEDVLAAGSGAVRYDEPVAERSGHSAAARHREQAGDTLAATSCPRPAPAVTCCRSAWRERRSSPSGRRECGGPSGGPAVSRSRDRAGRDAVCAASRPAFCFCFCFCFCFHARTRPAGTVRRGCTGRQPAKRLAGSESEYDPASLLRGDCEPLPRGLRPQRLRNFQAVGRTPIASAAFRASPIRNG